ncbi:hypothetical protein H6G17_03575 [Chroococcidiopsis sp. FACHB-1243]|uniref:hypothetical protein n=1 Tax=Chroococcidiopsis sp. [FACHB-1243] TaxID=2692781 RepID=UPI00177D2ED0|nr:hypothetical protein [Chroococcidiopsis sp. [FACHB-1243]]MBD2304598.1 hypothetical protein [Chroococcidiopsis sp. [FACHB-1243]]
MRRTAICAVITEMNSSLRYSDLELNLGRRAKSLEQIKLKLKKIELENIENGGY